MNQRRRFVARALSLLAAATLSVACSDGGIVDITDPPAPEEEEQPDTLPSGPAVVGDTILALDLSNRLLLLGSESFGTVSRVMPIRGVSVFNRIVGIDIRPSDGRLYGVGNDSRVYVIDPATGQASPVSSERFSPIVSQFFDVHFAMAFEPGTERIRLISAESRMNWSIDPDDGTARADSAAHYAEGDDNEFQPPALSGIAFAPAVPKGAGGLRSPASECERALMYVFDADLSQFGAVCDGDLMEIESLFEIPVAVSRCGEVAFDPRGNLFAMVLDVTAGINRLGTIDPETGAVEWAGEVPHDSPIQDLAYPQAASGSRAPRGG